MAFTPTLGLKSPLMLLLYSHFVRTTLCMFDSVTPFHPLSQTPGFSCGVSGVPEISTIKPIKVGNTIECRHQLLA